MCFCCEDMAYSEINCNIIKAVKAFVEKKII